MRLHLLLGGLAVALGIVAGYLIWRDNPWKDRAAAGEAQAGLNGTTGAIADRTSETTTRIIVQSEGLAHAVETAPGGEAPIPDPVRDSWLAGINGMRERPAANLADHPAEPPR